MEVEEGKRGIRSNEEWVVLMEMQSWSLRKRINECEEWESWGKGRIFVLFSFFLSFFAKQVGEFCCFFVLVDVCLWFVLVC
jgi:hypothetical protein